MRYIASCGFILLLLLPLNLSAQGYATDKGSFIVGGSASYSSQGGDLYENFDGDRQNTLTLNPYLLYFVSPGLGLGGEIVLARTSQGDDELTTIGVGPTVAYFFGDAAATVRPFVEAHASYVSLSFGDEDVNGWGVGGGAGAAFMLSPTVALTLQGVYEIQSLSADGIEEDVDGNEFRLEAGIAAFLF